MEEEAHSQSLHMGARNLTKFKLFIMLIIIIKIIIGPVYIVTSVALL